MDVRRWNPLQFCIRKPQCLLGHFASQTVKITLLTGSREHTTLKMVGLCVVAAAAASPVLEFGQGRGTNVRTPSLAREQLNQDSGVVPPPFSMFSISEHIVHDRIM